jgi:very-short-patch-repair endonuclease
LPRKRIPRNVPKARELRQSLTMPEVLIWQLLRKNPDGVHFRRQHAIGDYFLDFYCASAKLCIEVDGIAHDMGDNPQHDQARDLWLREQGIAVLRIPAVDILRSPEDVAEGIVRLCQR